MKPYGLGNLFQSFKQKEVELADLEKRIANAVLNELTDKVWYKDLLEEYKGLKEDLNNWLTKSVYIVDENDNET
ncbi:hypothetical protein NBRC13296_12435 [Paenibacillus chitinolyticus]|uniref:hypothetical protein n=1 Tax=Paenibacillus chitinolyticus TaxID=79263 RepID=UPI003558F266